MSHEGDLAQTVAPAARADSDDAAAAHWSAFPGDEVVPLEGGAHVHDPTILPIGGRYFCFSTTHEAFRVLRSSDDLMVWKRHEPLLPDRPAWLKERIPKHRAIWAPDACKTATGGLRMYYCASERFGWNTSYIGVAECESFDIDNPAAGWRDLGCILESHRGRDHFNAIDPEVIVDEMGRHWMFFGSYFSGVHCVELDGGTGLLLDPKRPKLTLIASNTEHRDNGIEGAAVVYRDGYYYLFAAYGLAAQGVRSDNRIIVGRSRLVTGPYVDRSDRPMVEGGHTEVLSSSPPMFGPGHCDVFEDTSGRWLMSYHFYDARKFWVDDKWGLPTLQVREVLWSDDGWPMPGLPVHRISGAPNRFAPRDVAGRWIQQIDFREPSVVEIRLDRTVSDTKRGIGGIWAIEGHNLMIRWAPGDPAEASAGAAEKLQLAHGGTYYVGRDRADKVIRGVRLEAPKRS